MFCSKCGKQAEDGSRFCIFCGSPFETQDANLVRQPTAPVYTCENSEDSPKPSAGGGRGVKAGIIAGAAVLLVLGILLISFFTNWFGMTGPMITVSNAAQNTFAKRNFTAEISADIGNESISGIAYVDIHMERETLHLMMELEVMNTELILAVYDENLILSSNGFYSCTDISESVEAFFDACEEAGDTEPDWEDILDVIDPYVYDEMSEYIDFRALNRCAKAYTRQLNNARWLKKNAGYSTWKENGVEKHILEPDLAVFLRASAPYFQDALKNPEDFAKMLDALEENGDMAGEVDIYAAFGLKDGYLVSIESEVAVDGETVTVETVFSDIGTTSLDVDKLADMLEKAKRSPW